MNDVGKDGRFLKGMIPWNKGKKLSLKHIQNMSKARMGKEPWNKGTKGLVKPNTGSFKKAQDHINYGKYGEGTTNWQGGLTSLNKIIRESAQYNEWRQSIYRRDNFTCQKCGATNTNTLNAHHKKRLSLIIKDNNIKTFEAALECSELWDIENVITHCWKCHYNLHGRK